jgi:hypothetical protein
MDIGKVIGGGFRLVRERPMAVVVWGLVYMVAVIAMTFAMRPLMLSQFQTMNGDPQAALANFGAMMGRIALFGIVFMVVYAVLFAASQRAVLQPEREGFFYLRLGMDELRQLALGIIFVIGFYIALIVVMVVLGLLMGLVGAATGSFGFAGALMLIEFIAIFALAVWFCTRFALAFPLTLLRRKIIIGESWRITRGRFWPLFGAFLVVFLVLLVIIAVVSLVTNGGYFAQLAQSAGDPAAVQRAAQQQMAEQFGAVSGKMIVRWIVSGIAGGLMVAVWGGTLATAARELTYNPDKIAETFA